jgi:hypothetical protein
MLKNSNALAYMNCYANDINLNSLEHYSGKYINVDKLHPNKDLEIQTVYYDDKIGKSKEAIQVLEEIVRQKNKMYLIKANAGGGKTFALMQILDMLSQTEEERDTVKIIAVPNSSQSNQNQYSQDLNIFNFISVVGKDAKTKESNIIDLDFRQLIKMGHRKFTCVYDKLMDIVVEAKKYNLKVVVVIDECHQLISATYRESALNNIDKVISKGNDSSADTVVMMSATPDKCLHLYKYDGIYNFKTENPINNLGNFNVLVTDSYKNSLLKTIKNNKEEGIASLVKINGYSHNALRALQNSLINSGFKTEMLTSKEKNDGIFKSIEQEGLIKDDIDVILCTSVIEAGISLKNDNISLIEVVKDANSFDMDGTIQFFARARTKIKEGTLIVANKTQDILSLKAMYMQKTEEERKLYFKNKCDISNSLSYYCLNANNQLDFAIATLLKYRFDTEGLVANQHEESFINISLRDSEKNNVLAYYSSDDADVHINAKAIINLAYKDRDNKIAFYNPMLLMEAFKGSIFYDNGSLKLDTQNKIDADENAQHYQEIIKDTKKQRASIGRENRENENLYRDWFKSYNFRKCINDLLSGKITTNNINNYGLDIPLEDLIKFRDESKTIELYKQLCEVFTHEEACEILYSRKEHTDKLLKISDINDIYELKKIVSRNKSKLYSEKLKSKNDILYFEFNKRKGNGPVFISENLMNCMIINLINNGCKGYNEKEFRKIVNDSGIGKKEKMETNDARIKVFNNKLKDNSKIKEKLIKKITKDLEMMFVIKTKSNKYQIITSIRSSFDFKQTLEYIKNSK